MRAPTLWIPLPAGLPTYAGRLGRYVAKPGALPVMVLHDDWDIFWVRHGEGVWELRDGQRLTAGKDEFAILPPFTPALTIEKKPRLDFWHCHFDFRPVQGRMSDGEREDSNGPGKKLLLPLTFSKRDAPEVWRAYRALSRVDVRRSGAPWRIERALLALVANLARYAQARAKRKATGKLFAPAAVQDPRIAELCRQITAAPAFPWKVAALADGLGLSAGHLHSLCRAMLGRSLKRYLVETRLQHALKQLLERPGGRLPSVKEVSAAAGFSSQHFFSRQFKKYYGVSPLGYRDGPSLA